MKISSSKLDGPYRKLTSIKFLKDPSTRGNSPDFWKPKDENEIFQQNQLIKALGWYETFLTLPILLIQLELDLEKRLIICQQDQISSFKTKTRKVVIYWVEILKINHVTKLSWKWNWDWIFTSHSFQNKISQPCHILETRWKI